MNESLEYLKNNVQIEPLVNGWYAWHHIIPPIFTALNVVERYIPIMESYISSPDLHAQAIKDPAFKGGPFIDLKGDRSEEVSELLQRTKQYSGPLFDFVKGIRSLDKLLKEKAQGYCLQPLYKEIPAELNGYVELYYDRHHRPDFRFYEGLLYKSPFYIEDFQTIALSLIEKDEDRPFIFTTPRLPDKQIVELKIPFRSKTLDELFKMKKVPQTYEYIKDMLHVPETNEIVFRNFFTNVKPTDYKKYTGDSVRIRYFGHACILIETRDQAVLLDPVLSYAYESDVPRFSFEDLPDEIDYVLITHGHHDHILLETMLQLRHKIKNIVVGKNIDGAIQDPSLKLMLRHLGFGNVIELTDLEQIHGDNGIVITGVPFIGEHHDIYINSKLCYHIQIGNYKLLAVADSCNQSPNLYRICHDLLGDVDALFMGMECDGAPASWAYGPVFTEKQERNKDYSRRGRGSNYNEGMDLVRRFNCKEVYVYAMGAEPWIKHLLDVQYTELSNPIIESNKLIQQCEKEGRVAERLFAEKELFIH
jgi:L-ascorbate metabolism protein UlaG (beta-lactamase superfamily)